MCIEYYVLSLDEETMGIYYLKSLEREPLEPVDEEKPKSDINDKMLILEESETSMCYINSTLCLQFVVYLAYTPTNHSLYICCTPTTRDSSRFVLDRQRELLNSMNSNK